MTAGDTFDSSVGRTPENDPAWAQIWDVKEMQLYLDSNISEQFVTEERIGIHPYWLRDIEVGAMEELRKELGKWSKTYKGYLLGFKRPILLSAAGNQASHPNPFIYFKFKVTRYIYRPEVGQHLKGVVTTFGQNAASCVVFGTFIATVYPANENDLKNWQLGDELEFLLESFDQLRKGVSLRGKCTSATTRKRKKSKKKEDVIEGGGEDPQTQQVDLPADPADSSIEVVEPPKKKRKKNK